MALASEETKEKSKTCDDSISETVTLQSNTFPTDDTPAGPGCSGERISDTYPDTVTEVTCPQTTLPTSPLVNYTGSVLLDQDTEEENWNDLGDLEEMDPLSSHSLSSSYRSPQKVKFVELAEQSTSNQKNGDRQRKKRLSSRTVSESSTVSCNSITSGTSSTMSVATAPDGGYGWVVVAASFFVNMIADGVTFSFGVMFDEFQDEFDCSKAATAGVVSVFHAVPLLTGPVATWLTDRYGCRNVTIIGSLMSAAGFLAAAFSHNIYLLYLFFGVVAGFGLSLCYVSAIIIVAYYFDRRRSFATGISVCGSGVGTFLFAPFTQYLMDSYDGWRGACIILSGVFLNMTICGMLFRDLPALTLRRKLGRGNSSRSLTSNSGGMPEIDKLRLALETGDVSFLIEEEVEEPRLASSLITIPTYIKNASKLPEDVLTLLANNRQTYNYIQDNFPDSLTLTKSVSDYRLEDMKEIKLPEPEPEPEEGEKEKSVSTGVKLKRRVSSMIRTKSILKKKTPESISSKPGPALETPVLETPLLDSVSEDNHADSVLRTEQKTQRLHNLRFRRQSLTYRGACLSTPRYHMRASSCPDIYKNSIGNLTEVEEDCLTECSHSLLQCCTLKYITLPFAVFCLSNFILYFWYDVPYVYTIEYAENILNIPNTESTQILSIIGILNTIGEVLVGWVADLPWVSSNALYASCMLVCGVVTALIPFTSSYPMVLMLSAMYGLCISANYSLTSPILVELVSLDQFSSAYGFLLACQGVGNLIGPPVAGWLYDRTGDWILTFNMAGFFIGFSGVLLIMMVTSSYLSQCVKNVTRSRTECNKEKPDKKVMETNGNHEKEGCYQVCKREPIPV